MANYGNNGTAPEQWPVIRESARAGQTAQPNWDVSQPRPMNGAGGMGATPWLPTGELPGYQVDFQSGSLVGELQRVDIPKAGPLRLSSGLTPEALESPVNQQEALQGSLKGLLARNLGHYVVATFLIGTQSPVSWEGFLHSVGNDYMVIYQPDQGRYITGDFYSLKFVEFHDTAGVKPDCPGYRRRDGQQMW